MAQRIFVVEDDPLLAESLVRALQQQGYRIGHARRGHDADALLQAHRFDLLLLDIGLPDIDGFELLRRLRARGDATPVLVVTAREAVDERVHGLDLGADDYLTKPFSLSELEARVRALLRRARPAPAARIVVGGLTVESDAHTAKIDGKHVDLTAREWALLELFLARPGHALSKVTIAKTISDSDAGVAPNTVEVYVSRLRAKLEPAGIVIRTVRGFGYLWEQPHG
ncbi:MAG TPA: response regulator transcription factor [Casimicrobiaceae bacterium]|jgi:DNA-binding response OmpR family regulator|nr:response regulator transcription factor [Casimicrobiaceae bacterium]